MDSRQPSGRAEATDRHAQAASASRTPVRWLARQGDLLIVRDGSGLPTGVMSRRGLEGPIVLALGENSGHRHVVHSRLAVLHAQATEQGERRLLEVIGASPVAVQHEDRDGRPSAEHDVIWLRPGLYQVVRQVQWAEERPIHVSD